MKHPAIQDAWNKRSALVAEGDKLFAKGNKLRAEGDKLCFGGRKLHAESYLLYAEAVIAAHGPKTTINWETGEVEA